MFGIFFVVFLSVIFLVHYYSLSRVADLFSVKKNGIFYAALITLSISFVFATVIERTLNGVFGRTFYTLAATWTGYLFFLFVAVLIFDLLNLVFHFPKLIAGITILVVVFLIGTFALINATTIDTKEVTIKLIELDNDLKIVQLSDIHVGTILNSEHLDKIVKETNRLKPDFVVITGDLVDGSGKIQSSVYKKLDDINAPIFFVVGNHEIYEDVNKVEAALKDTKIKILRNEYVDYKGVQLVGVDYSDDKANLKKVLPTIKYNRKKTTILLYHPPTDLKDASKEGITLQLAGHTHNGQIMPFNLLTMIAYPNVHGLNKYNQTYIYTNPGTGTWGPPMRLGSRNEITLLNLKKI